MSSLSYADVTFKSNTGEEWGVFIRVETKLSSQMPPIITDHQIKEVEQRIGESASRAVQELLNELEA